MVPDQQRAQRQGSLRRDLIRKYVRLQRDLLEADPMSSAYQGTVHAFRQMGYTLITSGFEDDLDRLLRLRVLDGGRATPGGSAARTCLPEMYVIERRPVSRET